ncbi:MAG: hypothetical protein RLZZ297_526 [Chloroflexota bacterium]|jgi:cytochrome c biogenesis protein CcmG, thiol:disulfide interchange protein DsbE
MRRFFLVCLFSLAACGAPATTAPIPADLPANVYSNATLAATTPATFAVGQPAPVFTWSDADGSTHSLADLAGKRVIVNFWGTWCEPCRAEMPELNARDGRDDVVVLGINKGEDIARIGPFARELGVDFALISDPDGDVSIAYGARNLPTSVFVARDGTIAAISIGVLSADALDLQLERMP